MSIDAQLLPLEHAHLTPGTRSSRAALEALLHESFTEIGASGRHYTRDALPTSPAPRRERAGVRAPPPPCLPFFSTFLYPPPMLHGSLATDGGPHLLLPINLAHAWRGHDESGDSQYDRASAAIDYDRPYTLIPIADTTALLIDNADGITVLASAPNFPLLILLCREWGDHLDEDIRHAVESLRPEFPEPTPDRIPLQADAAILFGAAWRADEAPDKLRAPIQPATYTIATASYKRGNTSILTLALTPEP